MFSQIKDGCQVFHNIKMNLVKTQNIIEYVLEIYNLWNGWYTAIYGWFCDNILISLLVYHSS